MKLILASNSPRRKDLLEKAGFKFSVLAGDFEEKEFSLDPVIMAERFACGKAKSVFEKLKDDTDVIVLGSDTVVYHDGKILGKPQDEKQAMQMLTELSGKTHTVISGYCLLGKEIEIVGHDTTLVTFNELFNEVKEDILLVGFIKVRLVVTAFKTVLTSLKNIREALTTL
jgi:septum formation protein